MTFVAKPSKQKPFYNESPSVSNFSEIQLLYIPSETYTRICCYNMVPTPSISETPIRKVQRSAARFVTGDFSYRSSVTNMLIQLKWPLLKQRRNFLKLTKYYTALLIPQSHLLPSQHQPVDTANVLSPLLLELTHIQIPSYLLLLICGILYLTH